MLNRLSTAPTIHQARAKTRSPKHKQPVDRFTPSSPNLEARSDALRQAALSRTTAPSDEQVRNFPGREGYKTEFLGRDLPLPALSPEIADRAAPLRDNPNEHVLKYTHFSIVMDKERRAPIFTAVNIDGAKLVDVPRDGDWAIDGRMAREYQLGNEAYTHNPIDRGHMVRRRDPVWGPEARQASEDTFVYTNAALQHQDLNQKEWLELENHIFDHAETEDQKMTVFTGPVFRDDDPVFDNKGRINPPTRIPEEFWKMVVWNDPQEGLKGAAFVLSQRDLIGHRSLFKSDLPPGRFQVYQVPIDKLEQMTHLKFGSVAGVCQESCLIGEIDHVQV